MSKSTYALLIYRSSAKRPPLSAKTEQDLLAVHHALQAQTSARGELHAVARLGDAAPKTVTTRGGAHEVTDGPYIETKEWLVGFYLVDCASEAEALERAQSLCPDPAHAIEVRPVAWKWNPEPEGSSTE